VPSPGTTASGFLRDRVRSSAINRRGASITFAFDGINDRDQIVGIPSNPQDLTQPQPSGTRR
jgi:hypothetical protein